MSDEIDLRGSFSVSGHIEYDDPYLLPRLQEHVEPYEVWSDWRCPDCGMGITKVHVTEDGIRPCGMPRGYWTDAREGEG